MQPIRILIADANDLNRYGLQAILARSKSRVEVLSLLNNLHNLEFFLKEQAIDVLLLDDGLLQSGQRGCFLQQLQEQWPDLRIILLSNHLHLDYVRKMLHSGIVGFIYKADRLEDYLLFGIETVRRGELYLSPTVSALPYARDHQANLGYLNHRDLEVLKLMHQGMTVQEIASTLGVTTRVVYRARFKLREVLEVRTTEQIVAAARERGLLT